MIDKHGRKALMTVAVIVILFSAGCSYFNAQLGLPDDHPAEEISEMVLEGVVKHNTGATVDIDLSHDDDDPNKVYPEADE